MVVVQSGSADPVVETLAFGGRERSCLFLVRHATGVIRGKMACPRCAPLIPSGEEPLRGFDDCGSAGV